MEAAAAAIAPYLRPDMLVTLESTTYPGTTEEIVQPILESERAEGRRRTSTSPSRPSASTRATRSTRRKNTPKVVGGVTPRVHRARRRVLRALHRHRRAGLLDARRRDDQAAREHLPLREHRAHERAAAGLRAHGHQHLGGRRRGQDQAVRLHAVLPGPRPRRALHPDRPVLPLVEGARVRLPHRVHRAGRQDQRGHAVLRRASGSWRR